MDCQLFFTFFVLFLMLFFTFLVLFNVVFPHFLKKQAGEAGLYLRICLLHRTSCLVSSYLLVSIAGGNTFFLAGYSQCMALSCRAFRYRLSRKAQK